jgi:hypothetical protein
VDLGYHYFMECTYPHENLKINEFCPNCGQQHLAKFEQKKGIMNFGIDLKAPGFREKFIQEAKQISKTAVYLARVSYTFAIINLASGIFLSLTSASETQTFIDEYGQTQENTVRTHPYQEIGWALLSSFLLLLMIGTLFRYLALQSTYREIEISNKFPENLFSIEKIKTQRSRR